MLRKLTMVLGFLVVLTGCGQAATRSAVPGGTASSASQVARAAPPEQETSASATLAQADALSRSQLGASRAGQFSVDRQVSELRQAILLYQKFLDLSDGRPEHEPAIKRSREAIADLKATLEFLLTDAGEPPAGDASP
jgi:hypothetical protein